MLKSLLSLPLILWTLLTLSHRIETWIPGQAWELAGLEQSSTPMPKLDAHFSPRSQIPEYIQIFEYFRGNWGESLLSREKVAPQIENAIQKSTPLALLAGAIGAMIALSIALFFEKGVVPFAQLSASIPLFWAAPVALLFFSRHRLTWSFAQGTWAPSLLLGIWLASQWVRICSEEYRKGVRSPHYKSAQGRGVSGISLKMIYGFLPQSSTVLQIFFMQMGNLISGTLIIEATFSRPGLGTYLIDALQKRDWPCFDAALLTTGLICIGSNILSEGVRQWIDPRLSRSSST